MIPNEGVRDTAQAPAVFRFEAPGLALEFEGDEAFVDAQVALVLPRVVRELGAAGTSPAASAGAPAAPAEGGAPAPSESAAGAPSLEDFYQRARSREGRGALQETILIFAYFLREHRDKKEFSIDSLNACFSLVGATPPKSLANTLGIMKRTQRFFDSGSARGHYALTEKGVAYVRRLIGAQ